MVDERDEYIQKLEQGYQEVSNQNVKLQAAVSQTSFQSGTDANLIQYQLETNEMKEKMEHFLRGDTIAVDKKGNQYWKAPNDKDDNQALLNEYGVNAIMAIIGSYLEKNTILSFYDEPRINEILADLGDKLADFILHNYEKIGMNSEYKKTRYELIVLTILHTVESSYRRALHGEEGRRINESRLVTQSDPFQRGVGGMPKKKSWSLVNPKTWV